MSAARRCARAAVALAALSGFAAAPCVAQPERAAAIRKQLATVLESREYRWESENAGLLVRLGDAFARALRTVANALGELFRFGGSVSPGTATFITWMVIVVCVACVIGALVWSLPQVMRWARLRRVRRVESRAVVSEPELAPTTSLLESAEALARRNDWRAAYRMAFLALLNRLDTLGALEFEASRTNGDYRRMVRAHAAVARSFGPISQEFDALVYGERSIGADEYQRCAAVCRAFLTIEPAS